RTCGRSRGSSGLASRVRFGVRVTTDNGGPSATNDGDDPRVRARLHGCTLPPRRPLRALAAAPVGSRPPSPPAKRRKDFADEADLVVHSGNASETHENAH